MATPCPRAAWPGHAGQAGQAGHWPLAVPCLGHLASSGTATAIATALPRATASTGRLCNWPAFHYPVILSFGITAVFPPFWCSRPYLLPRLSGVSLIHFSVIIGSEALQALLPFPTLAVHTPELIVLGHFCAAFCSQQPCPSVLFGFQHHVPTISGSLAFWFNGFVASGSMAPWLWLYSSAAPWPMALKPL